VDSEATEHTKTLSIASFGYQRTGRLSGWPRARRSRLPSLERNVRPWAFPALLGRWWRLIV